MRARLPWRVRKRYTNKAAPGMVFLNAEPCLDTFPIDAFQNPVLRIGFPPV
jgi:hypothetical protein